LVVVILRQFYNLVYKSRAYFMANFAEFRVKVQAQVDVLLSNEVLYLTGVDPDALYRLYLASFPLGANPVYRERTEHDCSACKRFIRQFGAVVAIVDNELVSVWDIEGLDADYAPVASALSSYVKTAPISNRFLWSERLIGVKSNWEGDDKKWIHLYADLPIHFLPKRNQSLGGAIAPLRDAKNVLQRALTEWSSVAVESVLDLMGQGSLYRGDEFKPLVAQFAEMHAMFLELPEEQQDNFCWRMAASKGAALSKIGNSAIGTLVWDLSEGLSIDEAVRKYEAVVAPSNYKRPKPIFTERMVNEAKVKVEGLGLADSLGRRFAIVEDIAVENVLFASADQLRAMASDDVFDKLADSAPRAAQNFSGIEEIPIEKFIKDVLPRTKALHVFLEGQHSGNLMSLIAPANSDAPPLTKWRNGFTWAYSGNVADSMKARVKAAGGKVDGDLCFRLQWNEDGRNQNDFDAHSLEPGRDRVFYPNKGRERPSSGMLDVDVLNPGGEIAVENIVYSDKSRMPDGLYQLRVNTFRDRGGSGGFRAEVEAGGQVYSFNYPHRTSTGDDVLVAEVQKTKSTLRVIPRMDATTSVQTLWGKPTNQFQPVRAMMLSPNCWEREVEIGNKHYFFFVEGLINPERPNGFFNEYLPAELNEHRRVFEALGGMTQVQSDDSRQLSGLGFSCTQRAALTVKVEGATTRILKVLF
jgi:hypothetical protein